MKNNKGISLIELVIVMIIMIMIVGFAVYNGSHTIHQGEATELYAEMTSVKNAVGGVMVSQQLEEGDAEWLKDYYDEDVGNGWYVIYGMGNDGYQTSKVRKNLNVDTIKRDYLVNFETGEIMLRNSVEVLGSSVRSYESVRALVESDKI